MLYVREPYICMKIQINPSVCKLNHHRFDPALEKAILFAVANTLVCDDLEEAKVLSWSGERFKGELMFIYFIFFLLLVSFMWSLYILYHC